VRPIVRLHEGSVVSGQTAPANQAMGAAEWGLLLLLAFVWGGTFFFGRIALSEWPPITVVFCRIFFGALLLMLIVVLSGQRFPRDRATWQDLAMMGVLNSALPFCLIVWGQTRIDSGLASIFYATTSLFTVLIAPIFSSADRLTSARLLGVLLGLAGVAIMIGPDVLIDSTGALLAKLAILGGALSYAFAAIWGRRFRGMPPTVTAAGQMAVASIIMIPITVLMDRPWTLPAPSLHVVGAIAGLALLSTMVGYLLFFTLLARAGSVNTSLVTLLVPPSALLLGALFLHERIHPRDLLGLLCIILGLIAIDGRPLRWLHRQLRSPCPLANTPG
jgi:drug/metabolite transporter (DMT)-like permease